MSGYGASRGLRSAIEPLDAHSAARMSEDRVRAAATAALTMKLEPFYRLRFGYPDGWAVSLGDPDGPESAHLYIAEGRAEGGVEGRFRGLNHPRRRGDGTFEPDFQAVIETDDGAALLVEIRGYGRAHPPGRRQIVTAITHVSDDVRYRRLNDVLCVGVGEVRTQVGGDTELVIDVAELVWEPIPE